MRLHSFFVSVGLIAAVCSPAGAQKLVPTELKSEADIFLSGAMTAAGNANTVYSWDLKFNYPKREWPIDKAAEHWFLLSPKLEFVA